MGLFLKFLVSIVLFRYSEGTNYPSNFACAALNSTVLQVTWTQASDASVAGYHLDVERVDGLKIEFGLPSIDLNHISYETYTFYGLGKFAVYNVTIHSYFTSGANGTDYVVSCQTDSDIPDASNFNFSCEGITTSAISCNWNALSTVYWNGVPQGYQLKYIGLVNDFYTDINLTTSDLAYTVTGLGFDTWYILHLRTINDAGLSPLTSTYAKTLGWNVTVENKTRYFCYETIPDRLEWEWEEMPCTVYVGIILAFMLLSLIFMILTCIMCCCKGKEETKNNMAINIFNEQGNDDEEELYDDDDDYDEDRSEEEEEDDFEDEYDFDSEGNPTEAAIAAKKKRKLKAAHKGGADAGDTDDESGEVTQSEEEPEYETSEIETESDEEYQSSEGDEYLDEEERIEKKEEKLAAIAAAKELRQKKREEKEQRKAEHDAERAKRRDEKEEERAKRKAKKTEEKAKRKADREEKAKQKAEAANKRKAAIKKRKQEQKEQKEKADRNNDNELDDNDEEESDYDSEDGDSEDYSDSEARDSMDNQGNDTEPGEEKKSSKKKLSKKSLVAKPVLSTINEKDSNAKKRSLAKNAKGRKTDGNKNKCLPVNKTKNLEKSQETKQDRTNTQKIQKNKRESGEGYSESDESIDDDVSDAEFYEDWDPNAENNPDTVVTKVNAKNDKSENTETVRKTANVKQQKNKDKDNKQKNTDNIVHMRSSSKAKHADSKHSVKDKNTGVDPSEDDEYSEDSDGYDSDDEDYDSDDYDYSSEESEQEKQTNKGVKGLHRNTKKSLSKDNTAKGGNTTSDDSGRGSAMSSDWGYEGNKQSNFGKSVGKSNEKKTGFFGSLFGKSSKVYNNKQNAKGNTKNLDNQTFKQNMVKSGFDSSGKHITHKSCGNNDWDSDGYENEDNIHASNENKPQSMSGYNGNWPGHAVKNTNYNKYANNTLYSSNSGQNPVKSALNNKKLGGNDNTDFGDWGSADDETVTGASNAAGYGLHPTAHSTITTKRVGGINVKSTPGVFNGNDNTTLGTRNAAKTNNQLHGMSNQINPFEHQNQMGMPFNLNGQNSTTNADGNFAPRSNGVNHNGEVVANAHASDQFGNFGGMQNVLHPMGHDVSVQDGTAPYTNQSDQSSFQNGQGAVPHNMFIPGSNSDLGVDGIYHNGNLHAHGDAFKQNGGYGSTNVSNLKNVQLSSVGNLAHQNGQYIPSQNNTNGHVNAAYSSYNPNAQSGRSKNHVNTHPYDNKNIGQDYGQNVGLNGGPLNRQHPNISGQGYPHTGASNGASHLDSNGQINSQDYANAPSGMQTSGMRNLPGAASGQIMENGTYNGGRPNKGKKLVSFRTNVASPPGRGGNQSNNLTMNIDQQGLTQRSVSMSAPAEYGTGGFDTGPSNNGFIMPDADIVLPDTRNNNYPRSPVGKFIVNKGAWNKGNSETPNADKRKGSKTPVEELSKRSTRMSLTEPEPVFETDRLAKKFPFLNPTGSKEESDTAKANDGKRNNSNPGGMRKNQSDSNLPMFLGKMNPLPHSKSTSDFQATHKDRVQSLSNEPSNDKDNTKSKSGKDAAAVNPDTRDKIFYGFGVGKWRWAAAKWLNTWKMKKRPAKTARSSWD